ncbi:uncharacterized protein LOC122816219 [Protopterus annectens]|uniref:uncharacterized protein LOC122816219 n=1 Tax=Protopterus annectens TaxID=7888 RepID=UPI001CFA2E3B|nr:uncharacterized protein LOC122816219 [Protopterus annectens]
MPKVHKSECEYVESTLMHFRYIVCSVMVHEMAGKKTYKCELCEYASIQKAYLKRHVWREHADRPEVYRDRSPINRTRSSSEGKVCLPSQPCVVNEHRGNHAQENNSRCVCFGDPSRNSSIGNCKKQESRYSETLTNRNKSNISQLDQLSSGSRTGSCKRQIDLEKTNVLCNNLASKIATEENMPVSSHPYKYLPQNRTNQDHVNNAQCSPPNEENTSFDLSLNQVWLQIKKLFWRAVEIIYHQ